MEKSGKRLRKTEWRGPIRSKFNSWLSETSKGKERQWALVLILICFVMFGISVHRKYSRPETERATIGDIIEDVKSNNPENTIGIGDALENYREGEKTEKALEIVNRLQVEFDKDPLDTVRIKELQSQLKALDIVIPLK